MKLIVAYIRPEQLSDVLEQLFHADVRGLTISRVQGHGGETEHPFPSMKAGEAFIRSETPSPSARDGRRDSPSHRPATTTARTDYALQTKE